MKHTDEAIPQVVCPYCGCDDERVEVLLLTRKTRGVVCGCCSRRWTEPNPEGVERREETTDADA